VAKVGKRSSCSFAATRSEDGDTAMRNEWLRRYPEDASVMAYIGRSGGTPCGMAG
jgi:hypothetical protein